MAEETCHFQLLRVGRNVVVDFDLYVLPSIYFARLYCVLHMTHNNVAYDIVLVTHKLKNTKNLITILHQYPSIYPKTNDIEFNVKNFQK